MPAVRAIVFDLDGTLVDSLDDIVASANHALGAHGFRVLPLQEIAGYVGDGARLLLARAARVPPDSTELDPLLKTFLDYYTAHATDHTRLAPGALHALDELAPFSLALCTNKPRAPAIAVLEGLGVADRFRVVIAGGDLERGKPDPLPLVHIARELGCAPAELVMVGDGPQDVEAGRRAGARTVGVVGGIAARERLLAAEPEALIESLAELPPLVRGWDQATSA